jgi:sugar O-acyltransferase (sialic acid O-acetyltransferase NeuD family)
MKLVIFGIGEQADVASFLFEHDSKYEVVAFCVDKEYLSQDKFRGKPVVALEDLKKIYPPEEYDAFVAIGYSNMNDLRSEKCKILLGFGYRLPSYISSKALTWPGFECGYNCLILEQNNIQPFVKIGDNVTLWSANHLGHHSKVEDNVFITSHVVVSGGVTIGKNSFLGVNATIRDHIEIAPYNLIASGALVNKSTEEYGVYIGVPAVKKDIKSTDLRI